LTLKLPSPENLKLAAEGGTQEDYHLVRLYSTWYSGWFYRHRLRMIRGLLPQIRLERVLEVGVGSGIFIPELLTTAEKVVGMDILKSMNGIRAMLEREEADLRRVELCQGSVLDIPYAARSFDVVVCISVLEHFGDPRPALLEISRVLAPDGIVVFGFPARTPVTNLLFGLLGYAAKTIHPSSHRTILAAIGDAFTIDAMQAFPLKALPLYLACRASKH
jgi:ubiquinone/menaquinone biosynthesis C-methylase UbiE